MSFLTATVREGQKAPVQTAEVLILIKAKKGRAISIHHQPPATAQQHRLGAFAIELAYTADAPPFQIPEYSVPNRPQPEGDAA